MKSRLILLLLLLLMSGLAEGQITYETVQVHYDSPWTYKNLQLIPVRFKDPGPGKTNALPGGMKLMTLPQGLASGKVKIREMQGSQGASVNSLEIINNSKDILLVSSGELLAGGKQDRMIGETRLLPPGKDVNYVDVFCVEKGRWDDKPKGFKDRGRADWSLRKVMDLSGRQSQVWKEIERQYNKEKKKSETYPYLALGRSRFPADTGYLKYFLGKYRNSDSLFAGFVAITGDKIISCELFASADMTNAAYASIITEFINEAVNGGATPAMKNEPIRNFMDQLLTDEAKQKVFLSTHGKVFRYEGRVIHIIAYGD